MSGNPCDPNNPDNEEEEVKSQEDSDENVPQNYPQRPAVQRPRPTAARPTQSPTTRAPTTVFQNRYNHPSLPQEESSEEEEAPLQYAQIPSTTARSAYITQRPQVRLPIQEPIRLDIQTPIRTLVRQPTHAPTLWNQLLNFNNPFFSFNNN